MDGFENCGPQRVPDLPIFQMTCLLVGVFSPPTHLKKLCAARQIFASSSPIIFGVNIPKTIELPPPSVLFQMCFIQCFFPKIFGSNSSLKGIQPPQTRPPRFVFPSPPVRSSIRCRARSGPTSCQALEFHAGNPSTKTLQNLLIHQEFQVPKMEGFKNLKNRLFWERENSLKPYPYSLYRWGFLHFRYQRHVWW